MFYKGKHEPIVVLNFLSFAPAENYKPDLPYFVDHPEAPRALKKASGSWGKSARTAGFDPCKIRDQHRNTPGVERVMQISFVGFRFGLLGRMAKTPFFADIPYSTPKRRDQ